MAVPPGMSSTAMVLAAGLGTRLWPLTDELPKALVPIGDRSALAHVVDRLLAAGIERVVVNAHPRPDLVARACGALALPAERVVEPDAPRGTAGGIAGAAAALGGGAVLAHNADILVDMDVRALLEAHAAREPFATLAVQGGLSAGEGTAGIDAAGRIVRLRDALHGKEVEGARFVGVQVLSEAARARLPESGCLVADVYLPALGEGFELVAAPLVRSFSDIGSPAVYLEANLTWLGERRAHVAAAAEVGRDVELERAIVGEGATIEGAGRLERVVVWPGARACAPLADAVVTSAGRVVFVKEGATRP